jgi:hypothetical protein
MKRETQSRLFDGHDFNFSVNWITSCSGKTKNKWKVDYSSLGWGKKIDENFDEASFGAVLSNHLHLSATRASL